MRLQAVAMNGLTAQASGHDFLQVNFYDQA